MLARLGHHLRDAMGATPEQGPERLAACGRAYVTWAVEDPAVARLVFRGGATTAQSTISPHPHDVLTTELDRLTESGHLPPGARPGAEFVVWAAIHGLAVLLIDGLVHIDDREDVERQAERLVFATFNGLARETAPEPDRPTPTTTHTRRLTRSPDPGLAPHTP